MMMMTRGRPPPKWSGSNFTLTRLPAAVAAAMKEIPVMQTAPWVAGAAKRGPLLLLQLLLLREAMTAMIVRGLKQMTTTLKLGRGRKKTTAMMMRRRRKKRMRVKLRCPERRGAFHPVSRCHWTTGAKWSGRSGARSAR